MFSQHPNPVSDASAKSQPCSGILTPASDNALNLSDEPNYGGTGGKKRKRDGNTMDDLLKDTFVVRPYPSTASVKSRTFQPLVLLPRLHLPLSAIDIAASAKSLPQSRLFESHVKILELENRMGSLPLVLIAQLDEARTLFAIERESRGLYVLFQLGSWINLQQLRAAAVALKQDVPKTSSILSKLDSAPIRTPESSQYSKKKRLAIELIQSMVKRPSTSLPTEPIGPEVDVQVPELPIEVPVFEIKAPDAPLLPPPIEEVPTQPTAADIVENVRNQYLEALYVSKASLAYFAKGPLSRARAAFHLDFDSNLDMNEYIAFLEGLVMSTTLIDKKYRDGIPTCISLIDIDDHSGEEVPKTAKPRKRKTSKKVKLGKNGLYSTEDTLIRRWWKTHDDDAESGAPGSSKEELTKTRISHLRLRETQLQMIIILEVLALQPLASAPEDNGPGLPSALPSIELAETKERPAKAKKSEHLATLIDVHIDRLCIWQSVASESSKAPEAALASTGSAQQMKQTDNIPRDFCFDVIAPFFSARLPDHCAIINRKLGGPVTVSQTKPRLSKSASFSSGPSRPGAATKRPVPIKPREPRTLQRVLSDDRERRSMSSGPNKKIALMRSATMPSGITMKREASEAPSLSSIPIADSQMFTANRGGLLNSKRFAQREVDMSSMIPEANLKPNPKAKQKAIVEAELKDAISALKRPNRELAGKSFAETIEKRSAVIPHSRKSKKPVRNPFFQNVQITATPKAVRRKDMHTESLIPSSTKTANSAEISFVPASSFSSIPQSTHRPPQDVLPGRKTIFSSVQATPTRKSSLSRNAEDNFGGLPPSSPFHVRRSSAQLFSAVPDSAVKGASASFTAHGIQETPVKKRPEKTLGHSHPAVPSFVAVGSNKENERASSPIEQRQEKVTAKEESIYKSLGWDDDNDIDDLA